VRTWSSRCAPRGLQRICCFFTNRLAITWLTADSTKPGRRQLAWPACCLTKEYYPAVGCRLAFFFYSLVEGCVFQAIVDARFSRSWTASQVNVDAVSGCSWTTFQRDRGRLRSARVILTVGMLADFLACHAHSQDHNAPDSTGPAPAP